MGLSGELYKLVNSETGVIVLFRSQKNPYQRLSCSLRIAYVHSPEDISQNHSPVEITKFLITLQLIQTQLENVGGHSQT